jgi:hypothetical protein
MDHYGDLVDCIGEMEPELDCLYSPCYDLSRIGMPDWCACPHNRCWAGCACWDSEGYRLKYGLYSERCGCGPGISGCGKCVNGQCMRRPPLRSTIRYQTPNSSQQQTAPAPRNVEPDEGSPLPTPQEYDPAPPTPAPGELPPPETLVPEEGQPQAIPQHQPPAEPTPTLPEAQEDPFEMPIEVPQAEEPQAILTAP